MKSLFARDIFVIPLIAFCVFVVSYIWSEALIEFLRKKSLGTREEIIRLLDLMFVEIDEKRITILLSLLSFGLGAVTFFAFFPEVLIGTLVGMVVTAAMWNVPLIFIRNMHEKRMVTFTDQMVDGLTIMANGIKSGLSVPQSMERIVENMGQPISQEMNLVLSQIRIGRNVEEALIELAVRIDKPDVQMFVTAVNILKETGGNLAETFQTIVYTIRERQKIEKKIQAMTAQGIMQGTIISMMPIVIMVVLYFTDQKFIMPLFTTTLGLMILMGVFVLIIIGGLMIKKIVKINV
jgi:tight adherence protein B